MNQEQSNLQLQNEKQKDEDIYGDELIGKFYYCTGKCFVIFETFLISNAAQLLIFIAFPAIFNENQVLCILLQIIYSFLIISCLRSLYLGSFISSEIKKKYKIYKQLQQNLNDQHQQQEKKRQCKQCKIYKFKDVHHCSLCNRCIYKMDHHCHFLGACVGQINYRYFLSYITLIEIIAISLIWVLHPQMRLLINFKFDQIFCSIIQGILLYLAGITFSIFAFCLITSHLYYLINDIKHLEFRFNLKQSRYKSYQIIYYLICCRKEKAELINNFQNTWKEVFDGGFCQLFWPKLILNAEELIEQGYIQSSMAYQMQELSTKEDNA